MLLTRRPVAVAAAAAAFLIAGGCSRASTPAASTSDTATATVSVAPATPPTSTRSPSVSQAGAAPSAAPSQTTVSISRPAGCAATRGGGIPAGAVHRRVIDVDGDGRPDTLWLSQPVGESVLIGVTTASGATFTARFNSASPDPRSVLLARPTPRGPVLVLANDGRSTRLLTVLGCALRTVTDTHRTPYVFDVGDLRGGGTGVGCEGPKNRVGLTGLNAVSSDGRRYSITRTFVILTGTTARNGASDTIHATLPGDQVEVDTATTVTCGTLTLTSGGLTVTA